MPTTMAETVRGALQGVPEGRSAERRLNRHRVRAE
jgi:hypothetical protein